MAYYNYLKSEPVYATTNDAPVLWHRWQGHFQRARKIEALRKMEVEARHRKDYAQALKLRDKRKEVEGAR